MCGGMLLLLLLLICLLLWLLLLLPPLLPPIGCHSMASFFLSPLTPTNYCLGQIKEEEYEGVDLAECGMEAYPEFTQQP